MYIRAVTENIKLRSKLIIIRRLELKGVNWIDVNSVAAHCRFLLLR